MDAASCRAAALDAQARRDYEAFHDLAWLAYRKGRQNDPELMLLLARAQSLSGRPGDAFVMLQRIAALGVTTDAAASEDFARVRALPRWQQLTESSSLEVAPAAPAAKPPTPVLSGSAPSTLAPSTLAPSTPALSTKHRAPSTGSPLSFTTLLTPTSLAYDAVSKRYLIADRQARRVAIVDEHTGQVSTLAGAQAGLGEIGGIAIDPRNGDLWIVSIASDTPALHRLQLVSGRVLSTVPMTGGKAPIVGLTFVQRVGLLAADSAGSLWRVSPRGRLEGLVDLEYAPRAIAADTAGRLYVSPGGPRLARLSVAPRSNAREVFSLPDEAVVDGGIAVVGARLHFLVRRDGHYEIRTAPLRK